MDKSTFLAQLETDWQKIIQAFEAVPHTELEHAEISTGQSIKELCCLFTAWDGEAMRQIAFITGQSTKPPFEFNNDTQQAWQQKQIEIKRIMPMQGVLVDMVGTRQRLVACIDELNVFYFEQWLTEYPQFVKFWQSGYVAEIEIWRASRKAPSFVRKFIKKFINILVFCFNKSFAHKTNKLH